LLCLPVVRFDERLLVAMAPRLCGECGAGLERRATSCPLCGGSKPAAAGESEPPPPDIDSYQSDVRRLREQLRRLREGAEAV
jgi:predicted amidophosphoribosyltransferase